MFLGLGVEVCCKLDMSRSALEGSGNIIMLSLAQFHQQESKNNCGKKTLDRLILHQLYFFPCKIRTIQAWVTFMERFFIIGHVMKFTLYAH